MTMDRPFRRARVLLFFLVVGIACALSVTAYGERVPPTEYSWKTKGESTRWIKQKEGYFRSPDLLSFIQFETHRPSEWKAMSTEYRYGNPSSCAQKLIDGARKKYPEMTTLPTNIRAGSDGCHVSFQTPWRFGRDSWTRHWTGELRHCQNGGGFIAFYVSDADKPHPSPRSLWDCR
jgi:hypothetical protein